MIPRPRIMSDAFSRNMEIYPQSPRRLPIVKIGDTYYFVDARLNELRNVKNPNDREKMEGSEEFYIKTFGVEK